MSRTEAASSGDKSTAARRHPRSSRPTPSVMLAGAILALGAAAVALPFVWMLASSVKPRSESTAYPPVPLPSDPTLEYFRQLFSELDFGRYLVNTLALVAISLIGLLFMTMAGYGFSKYEFRGKKILFFMVLATMMIPVQVTMIPSYLILNGAGLTNTLVGIALPTLVSGYSIFLFRQFMSSIPNEVIEAARIDGASEMRIFWQIVLPMSKPILSVQVILTFIGAWNSFLWPLVMASDQSLYTLSVGVSLLNQQTATNPSLQMAASTVMVLPILIVFLFFQRYIVQGFSTSGSK